MTKDILIVRVNASLYTMADYISMLESIEKNSVKDNYHVIIAYERCDEKRIEFEILKNPNK